MRTGVVDGNWQLIGSVVVGYFISGYLPDAFTWIGAGIIICAGSFLAWSETRVPRARAWKLDQLISR